MNKFRTQYLLGPKTKKSNLVPTLFNFPIWTDTKKNLTSKLEIYKNSFEVCNQKIHVLQYEKLNTPESPEKLVEEISKLVNFISKNNKDNTDFKKKDLAVRLNCLIEDWVNSGSFQNLRVETQLESEKPDMNMWFSLSEKKDVNDRLREMQYFFWENKIEFVIPAEYYFSVSGWNNKNKIKLL